jgi:phosphatidylethanolamine/phosphatidyl-N-methylethanolamine N-methyltransferase
MNGKTSDALLFFRAWLSAPLQVASVTPSGRALSSLMTAEITAQTGAVIELGPGTGVFTQALLDRGVAESDLVLVESSTAFADALSLRYPAARMLQIDAAHLRKIELQTATPIGAVASGLPLLSMPLRQVLAIVEGSFSHLRQNAGSARSAWLEGEARRQDTGQCATCRCLSCKQAQTAAATPTCLCQRSRYPF